MSVFNLMYPQWYPVPCNDSISVDVLCINQDYLDISQAYINVIQYYVNTTTMNRVLVKRNTICQRKEILFQSYCYFISTKSFRRSFRQDYMMNQNNSFKLFMNVVLSNVALKNTVFCYGSEFQRTQLCYTYDNLIKSFQFHNGHGLIKESEKFNVFQDKVKNNMFSTNENQIQVYECNSGEYLSKIMFHNQITNCASGDDEAGSICFVNGEMRNDSYCQEACLKPDCTCPDLYYQKLQGGCFPYSSMFSRNSKIHLSHSKMNYLNDINNDFLTDLIVLNYSSAIHTKSFNNSYHPNLYTDCTNQELSAILNSSEYFVKTCKIKDEIQCTYGCAKCFAIHKLCVYELDHNGKLMHCPSGAHLNNCTEMECNNMFKCYDSYCIPYR